MPGVSQGIVNNKTIKNLFFRSLEINRHFGFSYFLVSLLASF